LKDLFIHNRTTFFFLISITLIQIVATSSVIGAIITYHHNFQDFNLVIWIGVYAIFALFMAFSILPNSFIAFLGGFFLDFVAMPYFIGSYLIALSLSFWVARKVDHGNFTKSLREYPKITQFVEALQHHEKILVMLARFSPLFPFAVMNQVLYSCRVSYQTYMWASVVGMLPRMLLMTYFGTQAATLTAVGQMTTTEKLIQTVFVLITVVAFSVLLATIGKKIKNTIKKNQQNELL